MRKCRVSRHGGAAPHARAHARSAPGRTLQQLQQIAVRQEQRAQPRSGARQADLQTRAVSSGAG
eukprot:scaffold916_cov516-Prasinococcus_capsulatus_cf.AAC.20